MANQPTQPKPMVQIELRPPPGSRFTLGPLGFEVILQCNVGETSGVLAYIRTWLDTYVEPIAMKEQAIARHIQEKAAEAMREKLNAPNPRVAAFRGSAAIAAIPKPVSTSTNEPTSTTDDATTEKKDGQ